jgi:peptide/nickel transport system substrate-binding protein
MRRIAFLLLAVINSLPSAPAATRPHYGGTLRIAVQAAPAALDISGASSATDYWDMARVLSLFADNLVNVDAQDRPHPALAVAWQSDASAKHWQFTIRRGVKFQDGEALTADSVAQILTRIHPEWTVRRAEESVTIESDHPLTSLLAELALQRNAILKRNSGGLALGTGPFRITEFEPARKLKLVANDDCWSGRPFADAIEIDFGQSAREQAVNLELGRADIVDTAQAPGSNSTTRQEGSLPVELVALVFSPHAKIQEARVREALALAIDRKPLLSVLSRNAAEPAGSLLPNWMTGYSSLFPSSTNLTAARRLATGVRTPLTLSYDPRDPQAQLVAERIALNAQEAGLSVDVSLSGAEDVKLVRMALPSPDPATSLREIARQLGLPQPEIKSTGVDDLYQAERAMLEGSAVIPLFHLAAPAAAGNRVHNWQPGFSADWRAADLWLEAAPR